MKKLFTILSLLLTFTCTTMAQIDENNDGFNVTDNTFNPNRALDSLDAKHKKVPKGLKVWTIDDAFGDITEQTPDTLQHLAMNYVFTTGRYAEYNTTGNLGAPRINRIATDRDYIPRFAFTEPYGYFITKPSELRFTNTLSPITNLYFNSCGNHDNGEDHLKALFATNVNKQAGVGFKFDYVYGRGYYNSQSTALFDYTFWASYLGEKYQSHLILSWDHMKNTENGGITLDDYILHPEAQSQDFDQDEIPVVHTNNWSRNNAFHATLSHRYNLGFYKKVPMTEMEKEAKRFALQAEKEKEELAELEAKEAAESGKDSKPSKRMSGRPTDAKVVGELSDSTINEVKRQAQLRAQMGADSLTAKKQKAEEDTSWMKDEYIPVTSFIHTMHLDNHTRTYIAQSRGTTNADMYLNRYTVPLESAPGDSIYDQLDYFDIRNRFAIGLHEGLNKYIPMGAKIFIAHELRHYSMAALSLYNRDSYNENNISVGGQIIKTLGNMLHYNATVEANIVGEDVGDLKIDGTGDIHFNLFHDSISVALKAFYHLTNPNFMQRHYHSKFLWWDHDGLNKQMHTHLEGVFSLDRTHTALRVAYDNLQNYVYIGESYNRDANGNVTCYTADVRQSSKNLSLFTIALEQNVKWGILNWENRLTFQKSNDDVILAVPSLNYWTNLYLSFRIAKVLRIHFGAEAFIFSKYNAPEYCSLVGQYAVQENDAIRTKVGNHPYVNAYINCMLKQCRFFVMMSHINASDGNDIFTTPHYPMNTRVLRLGLIWTFNN